MNDILSNDWFVGIVSGLICAFITFVITKVAGTIKHRHRIEEANRFVVGKLRTFIVNGGQLPDELLLSLRHSTARKFKLKSEELLSPVAYLEEVASEITGNVYLRIDQQKDLLTQINRYIQLEETKELEDYIDSAYYIEDMKMTGPMITMLITSVILIATGIYVVVSMAPQLTPSGVKNVAVSGAITLTISSLVAFSFPRRKK